MFAKKFFSSLHCLPGCAFFRGKLDIWRYYESSKYRFNVFLVMQIRSKNNVSDATSSVRNTTNLARKVIRATKTVPHMDKTKTLLAFMCIVP